ncbi:Exc2 family lipoprotein [Salmonella enterica subsp. enterica serovar Newport]|nr:Exc2 family lipoprotein [Salmonella enterica subsp. enterica serovar Newport]
MHVCRDSSFERHTRHYLYASNDRSVHYFYINRTENIRMIVPFFRPFWDI